MIGDLIAPWNDSFVFSPVANIPPPSHWVKGLPSRENILYFMVGESNASGTTLKTLTSLNKESRLLFLVDSTLWSFPSVYSLSDYSIWKF